MEYKVLILLEEGGTMEINRYKMQRAGEVMGGWVGGGLEGQGLFPPPPTPLTPPLPQYFAMCVFEVICVINAIT